MKLADKILIKMPGLCCRSDKLDTDEVNRFSGHEFNDTGCSMRGAWRALQCMTDDIAIVIHGPEGCNNEFKHDCTPGIASTYSTKLTEQDIIRGGLEKLEKLVVNIDTTYKPKLIVILGTCASELIGDDIDGLVRVITPRLNSNIICLHTSGVSGLMQSQGHNLVLNELARKVMKKQTIIPKSINYVGYSLPWDSREGRDLSELKLILDKIGVRLNAVLSSGLSYDKIVNAPAAALNVIRCPGSAYETVEYMQHEFGTPYICPPVPIGLGNTTDFLFQIADHFSIRKEAQPIILKEEQAIRKKINKIGHLLKGKKVAISIGANRTIHLVRALAELGVDIKVISFSRLHESDDARVVGLSGRTFHCLKKVCDRYGIKATVLACPNSTQFKNAVVKAKVDLVFDAHTHRKLAYSNGCGFFDSMNPPQPHLFYNGALALAYDLANGFNQSFYRRYQKWMT